MRFAIVRFVAGCALVASCAVAADCADAPTTSFDASEAILIDAYAAILDSIATAGVFHLVPGAATVRVNPNRPVDFLPNAPATVIAGLHARGYATASDAVPCPGEIAVSFGPPTSTKADVFEIEAEYRYLWNGDMGDIEYFRYDVDCTTGTCSVVSRTGLGQEAVGFGGSVSDCS